MRCSYRVRDLTCESNNKQIQSMVVTGEGEKSAWVRAKKSFYLWIAGRRCYSLAFISTTNLPLPSVFAGEAFVTIFLKTPEPPLV